MSSSKQAAPQPIALALQHLLQAAGQLPPGLGAVLGRRALQIAGTGAQGLPRGASRPCPHCGAVGSAESSEVRKLPRSAVRRQLKQQQAAQQRGRGGSQGVQRWLSVSTCSVCGQQIKRLLQHPRPPVQQGAVQQQMGMKRKADEQAVPLCALQQQHEAGQQPPGPSSVPQASSGTPWTAVDAPAVHELPGQGCHSAPPAGAGHGQRRQQEEDAEQRFEQRGDEGEQQVQQQQQQLEELPQAATAPPERMAWAGVQEAWRLDERAAVTEEVEEGAAAAEEEEDAAGVEEEAADRTPLHQPSGKKKRRLSWSDDLSHVKLIERAPRPQLRRIYSWHRLARSWKAAKLTLPPA